MPLDASVNGLIELAIAVIIAGGVSGFLAGLFGVGGGAIIVPVLYSAFQVLHVPDSVLFKLCIGTSLAIILPTSIRSTLKHKAKSAVDMDLLKQWAIPIILGVILGSFVVHYAPSKLLKIVFVIIATFNGVRMILGRDDWRLKGEIKPGLFLSVSGGIIGLLSSLMGIGGGQLASLFMSFYGRPIHQVVATSAGVGVLVSIPGTLGQILAGWHDMAILPPFSLGYVSLIGVALMIPTSLLAAPIGVNLAHKLPKRQLEVAFGVFLILVSLWIIATLFGY